MSQNQHPAEEQPLPFVAPCRTLHVRAPLRWISLGWKDMKKSPLQSLMYGIAVFLISLMISFAAWQAGNVYVLAALLSGFIFMGPLIAIGPYSISKQLQSKQSASLLETLRLEKQSISHLMIFAVILLVVLLVWARAASMVHIFFPEVSDANLADFAVFLGIGTAVGSIFATIIFCASAFSLPMLMDKKVDTVTAVLSSVNAVLRNKQAMLVWAAIIVFCLFLSFISGLIGLIVLMPLIGHATWHAYQETIDAGIWPAR